MRRGNATVGGRTRNSHPRPVHFRMRTVRASRSEGSPGRVRVMPKSFIYDPAHWRERAEEIRTLAEDMDDPQARASMLRIADEYEELAQRIEDQKPVTGL